MTVDVVGLFLLIILDNKNNKIWFL